MSKKDLPSLPKTCAGATDERGSELRSSDWLAGFSPLERAALTQQRGTTPIDQFHTIPEYRWRRYNGCGNRFIERLRERGWVSDLKSEPSEWWHGLSVRAVNCLQNQRLCDKVSVRAAIESGRLKPENVRCRNFGWKTYEECCAWVGLPKPIKTRKWRFNPYTGQPLSS